MKIALVHDWLTGMRGGEKVLEQFCLLYPQAHIYTLLHYPEKISPIINRHPITTSFVQNLPGARRRHQWYLPLFPAAAERFDLSAYDLVISSSHCVAKGVITLPHTCHISYVYTPMRYAWDMYHQYFCDKNTGKAARAAITLSMSRLRLWDRVSADRPDYYITISRHTARRIAKHYRRRADVLYPPVDSDFYTTGPEKREDYFLVVSALVPYKRIDLAVEACNRLQLPLAVIGEGPEKKRLQAMASPRVKFLGYQKNESLRDHYRRCRALLFPGEEDFGIVPLEAQCCGCPVIAYGKGGALETVSEPERGLFFGPRSGLSLEEALERFDRLSFDAEKIRRGVLSFGQREFRAALERLIGQKYSQYQEGGDIPHVKEI